MLKDAVAIADSVIVSGEYNPWFVFGDGCNQEVVSDSQPFLEKVVLRRKVSRDTNECWFGAQSASSPSTTTSVGRSGIRISNIVEEGRLEYVDV